MTSRVTDRDGEQDVGSLPRHSPVLNPLPPPLTISVQMMTLKLELHLQVLIALIVSYLIGVGVARNSARGMWRGVCRGRGDCQLSSSFALCPKLAIGRAVAVAVAPQGLSYLGKAAYS